MYVTCVCVYIYIYIYIYQLDLISDPCSFYSRPPKSIPTLCRKVPSIWRGGCGAAAAQSDATCRSASFSGGRDRTDPWGSSCDPYIHIYYYIILYYIILYYIILYYIILYYIIMYYIIFYYFILYYVILHYTHSPRRVRRGVFLCCRMSDFGCLFCDSGFDYNIYIYVNSTVINNKSD